MLPYVFAPATTIKSSEVNENFRLLSASGIVSMFAGSAAPDGWKLCDGSSLLRSEYPDLFAAIGTQYGAADGSHFNVPNIKGKVVVGLDSSQTEFDSLGETGGKKSHTLTTAEIPSHYHVVDPPLTYTNTYYGSGWATLHGAGGATVLAGAGGNMYGVTYRGQYRSGGSNLGGAGSYDQLAFNVDHSHYVDIGAFNSGSVGSGGAHNNLQPYIVLNFIIKI